MKNLPGEEELIYLSRQFANMFGLPVRLYKNKQQIYFFSTIDFDVDPITLCADKVLAVEDRIGYYVHVDTFYYGIVNCRSYCFVTGPASEVRIPDAMLQKLVFMLGLGLEKEEISDFRHCLDALTGIHLDTILQIAVIFNYAANGEMRDISDIRIHTSEQESITSDIKNHESSHNLNENVYRSNVKPYHIEKDIVRKVKNGDVEGLVDGATKIPSVATYQLAPYLIRHQKNFFIHLETIVSRAALEAGVDPEEIFATESKYMAKIESLDNTDRVKNLQYHMILDYANRVRQLRQYNSTNSKFINEVSGYIRNHITESISTEDIARHFKKSRGRITTRFKQESGINLSDFIRMKKIQEACELLYHTDKSLCEISNYLGFSSQSYFTKVFKEINGMTPAEYRNSEK